MKIALHYLRWKIAAAAYWVFLKALPEGRFKSDYLRAVISLRTIYPKVENHP